MLIFFDFINTPSRMKKIFYLLILTVFFTFEKGFSQDFQPSQFNSNALHLNPAFTGSTGGGRAAIFWRNQWPQLEARFHSYGFAFDYHFSEFRSSFGIIAKADEAGVVSGQAYKKNEIGLSYAFAIPINETTVLQPGLQASYTMSNLNYADLLFPDQLSNTGPTGKPTRENFPTANIRYFDVATGLTLLAKNFWFGVSVHHLARPNVSFLDGESKLPMLISTHLGYRHSFADFSSTQDRSIMPMLTYRRQGQSQQIQVGSMLNYEPLVFGLFYRGMPFVKYNDIPQNDSFVLVGGLKYGTLSFTYSYDFAMSDLSRYKAGAHELSLVFTFGSENVYCPDPYGMYQKRTSRRGRW
jgi:type IX secretion system PorP/SprF family membrane protein